jgi:hypothetical protein
MMWHPAANRVHGGERSGIGDARQEFRRALTGRTAQVIEWSNLVSRKPAFTPTYSRFSYMLETLAEINTWAD